MQKHTAGTNILLRKKPRPKQHLHLTLHCMRVPTTTMQSQYIQNSYSFASFSKTAWFFIQHTNVSTFLIKRACCSVSNFVKLAYSAFSQYGCEEAKDRWRCKALSNGQDTTIRLSQCSLYKG
jgi:hypothetical protein